MGGYEGKKKGVLYIYFQFFVVILRYFGGGAEGLSCDAYLLFIDQNRDPESQYITRQIWEMRDSPVFWKLDTVCKNMLAGGCGQQMKFTKGFLHPLWTVNPLTACLGPACSSEHFHSLKSGQARSIISSQQASWNAGPMDVWGTGIGWLGGSLNSPPQPPEISFLAFIPSVFLLSSSH